MSKCNFDTIEGLCFFLFQDVNYSVVITDDLLECPGPKIIYVNPQWEKITGYSLKEVVGNTPRILQGPKTERSVLDNLKKNLSEGRTFKGFTINYTKDGEEIYLSLIIMRFFVFDKLYYFGIHEESSPDKVIEWITGIKDIQIKILENLENVIN